MGGDWLLGGDFRAGRYSGNLAFAEAEGGVLQATGGLSSPVCSFSRLHNSSRCSQGLPSPFFLWLPSGG